MRIYLSHPYGGKEENGGGDCEILPRSMGGRGQDRLDFNKSACIP